MSEQSDYMTTRSPDNDEVPGEWREERPLLSLEETSEGLVTALRKLGNEYGPLGVALAAAQLTDINVLVSRISRTPPMSEQQFEVIYWAGKWRDSLNPQTGVSEYGYELRQAVDALAESTRPKTASEVISDVMHDPDAGPEHIERALQEAGLLRDNSQ